MAFSLTFPSPDLAPASHSQRTRTQPSLWLYRAIKEVCKADLEQAELQNLREEASTSSLTFSRPPPHLFLSSPFPSPPLPPFRTYIPPSTAPCLLPSIFRLVLCAFPPFPSPASFLNPFLLLLPLPLFTSCLA